MLILALMPLLPAPGVPEPLIPEPLLPEPEVWASTNGAVTRSTARAVTEAFSCPWSPSSTFYKLL